MTRAEKSVIAALQAKSDQRLFKPRGARRFLFFYPTRARSEWVCESTVNALARQGLVELDLRGDYRLTARGLAS